MRSGMNGSDTIYALASGHGKAGVAVCRISGVNARAVLPAFGHAAPLAARMAPPYNREQSFLALNGIQNRALQPGEQLKLIVVG